MSANSDARISQDQGQELGRHDVVWTQSSLLSDDVGQAQHSSHAESSTSLQGATAQDPQNGQVDPFVMASLQTTASAILAAQEQQLRHDYTLGEGFPSSQPFSTPASVMSGSESETGISHTDSPRRRLEAKSDASTSSRAVSQTKGRDCAEKTSHSHHDRHMWTTEETNALVAGCNKHGIGNWKAILNDKELTNSFKGRTPGDLKDRFRTYFPDAYHDLYPNAKTHTSRAVRSKAPDGSSIFEKGKTKERRPFSASEDEVLKRGYEQHGSHWAVIARDPVFEGRRKSTDLRDRFRNAFPSLYEQAGYKPRTKVVRKERRASAAGGLGERPPIPHNSKSEEPAPYKAKYPHRSDTSASEQSQATSEQSDDESASFNVSQLGLPFFSSSSARSAEPGHVVTQGQTSALPLRNSQTQMPRSGSDSMSNGALEQLSHAPLVTRQVLRRSHSTKKGTAMLHSIEQAMKNANVKSTREAMHATHHHGPQSHSHHAHIPALTTHSANALQQDLVGTRRGDEATQNPHESSWTDKTTWRDTDTSHSRQSLKEMANAMDLDQVNEMINVQTMPALTSTAQAKASGQALGHQNTPDMGNTAAQNALLDSLLLQWNPSEPLGTRNGPNDSFQALIDPVAPSSPSLGDVTGSTSNYTPISSSVAPPLLAPFPSSASRRDHEHNQWAGDLLHRGNFDALLFDPQAFINLFGSHTQGGQDISSQPQIQDQEPSASEHSSISLDNTQTLPGQGITSYNAEAVVGAQDTMQRDPFAGNAESKASTPAPYRNPFSYPADDLSLLSSAFTGDSGLSTVAGGISMSNDVGSSSRRRRSTDTLRENNGMPATPAWKVPSDGTLFAQIDESAGAPNVGQSTFSDPSDDPSRSYSSLDGINDDDVPSRAASVADLNLLGAGRDQTLYAESLPDLSAPSFGGGQQSVNDSSTFGNIPPLQMSYDDLDLPSFLNRSPSFANFAPSSSYAGNLFASPRLPNTMDNSIKVWASRPNLGHRDAQSQSESAIGRNDAESSNTRNSYGSSMQQPNGGYSSSASTSDYSDVSSTSSALSDRLGSLNAFDSFPTSRMNDAGSLDRLEHLYLEGLHTPSSPFGNMLSPHNGIISDSNVAASLIDQRWPPPQRTGRSSVEFGRTETIRPSDGHDTDQSR